MGGFEQFKERVRRIALDHQDRVYGWGKYLAFVPFIVMVIFGPALVMLGLAGVLNPAAVLMKMWGFWLVLLGIHFWVFNVRWSRDHTAYYLRFVKNKPKLIQKWMEPSTDKEWNRIFVFLLAAMCLGSGIFLVVS